MGLEAEGVGSPQQSIETAQDLDGEEAENDERAHHDPSRVLHLSRPQEERGHKESNNQQSESLQEHDSVAGAAGLGSVFAVWVCLRTAGAFQDFEGLLDGLGEVRA